MTSGAAIAGAKVMVIDDSNTIRRSAEIFLVQAGCKVILAEDGFDALAKITDHQPDIIFCDIMMPRLDGYQTCALIKRNARFATTPVVMLSSKDGLFDRARPHGGLRRISDQTIHERQPASHRCRAYRAEGRLRSIRAYQSIEPGEPCRSKKFLSLKTLIARAIDETDAALLSQACTSRDLQQDLLRVRMVPFKNLSERLYRIVRQAAKEAGKRANLEIQGSEIELDRSVLERITAPFEHMLRNSIAHGIEPSAERIAAGKSEVGEIRLEIRQEGNEVMLAVADDGKGLDLARIRAKAIERGLMAPADIVADTDIAEFIFQPGFSTATEVTQLAGRGIGIDVVKSEIIALGGRVEVTTDRGKGTRFIVYLPLTLAMAQAIVVQAGTGKYAIPGLIVDQVRQVRAEELAEYYRTGVVNWQNRRVPFYYLPRLLGDRQTKPDMRRNASIVLVRSGSSLIAVHADEVIGNQEIVVKNTGPMLARVTGITGATVLGSGEIVLILNPVVIAARETAVAVAPEMMSTGEQPVVPAAEPIVMIVDDSLTVRKVTGRLLVREGYHVVTARDGVDAVEQLGSLVPDVLVIDIEMPRMDGFDLTRHIRASDKLKHLPIVIVTSRIADRHRNFAMEIGVNAFLGKPYRDEELLATIAGYLGDKARTRRPEQGVADGVPH